MRLLIIAFGMLLFFSCKKSESNESTAGKGGSATLKITPQHHTRNIDSCTIYVKYNTLDVAASYDDSVICVLENGRPVGTITQLKKGRYYLYGYGWDPLMATWVKGGLPFTIAADSTYQINLSVTEQH